MSGTGKRAATGTMAGLALGDALGGELRAPGGLWDEGGAG